MATQFTTFVDRAEKTQDGGLQVPDRIEVPNYWATVLLVRNTSSKRRLDAVGLETAPCIPHIAGLLIQLIGLRASCGTQAAFIRKPKVVAVFDLSSGYLI